MVPPTDPTATAALRSRNRQRYAAALRKRDELLAERDRLLREIHELRVLRNAINMRLLTTLRDRCIHDLRTNRCAICSTNEREG